METAGPPAGYSAEELEPLRKVTAFITRGDGPARELLVFDHAESGTQVPAGTVEPGESFEAAARREAFEESGLSQIELVSALGERLYQLPPGEFVLNRDERLRWRPGGAASAWPLRRGLAVRMVGMQDDWAHVLREERSENDAFALARFEGWVPARSLLSAQRRAFYHFRTTGPTQDAWDIDAEEGRYVFHLYWLPLTPRPTLVGHPNIPGSQDGWLEEFWEELR